MDANGRKFENRVATGLQTSCGGVRFPKMWGLIWKSRKKSIEFTIYGVYIGDSISEKQSHAVVLKGEPSKTLNPKP